MTSSIAIGGFSSDYDFRRIPSTVFTSYAPFMALYEGTLSTYLWGKTFQLSDYAVNAVVFSPDRSMVLGHTKNTIGGAPEYLIIL